MNPKKKSVSRLFVNFCNWIYPFISDYMDVLFDI